MNPHHLISIAALSAGQLGHLLDSAQALRPDALSGSRHRTALAGKTVCTLFFEPSTRTRSSFQLAAARLGADVLNFDAGSSSAKKGETAVDTMRNLEAMGVDCFVVRTGVDGELKTLIDAAKYAFHQRRRRPQQPSHTGLVGHADHPSAQRRRFLGTARGDGR